MFVLLIIGGLIAIAISFWLGRQSAPEAKVVHHNHKDEKAVFSAYLKGMNDYAQLMRDAAGAGVRLSPHPKNKNLMAIIDPRITEIVGEVHISKKCQYSVEWFDTQEILAAQDRPQGVPNDFVKVWDNDVQEYTWRRAS
jgi:hypothetical protein